MDFTNPANPLSPLNPMHPAQDDSTTASVDSHQHGEHCHHDGVAPAGIVFLFAAVFTVLLFGAWVTSR